MFKVLDEDPLGELLVIDDSGGLAHHEVPEHLLVPEPLSLRQQYVHPPEALPAHHHLLGVGAAEGEGGLLEWDSLLFKEVEVLGTTPVEVGQAKPDEEKYLDQHCSWCSCDWHTPSYTQHTYAVMLRSISVSWEPIISLTLNKGKFKLMKFLNKIYTHLQYQSLYQSI